MSRWDNSPTLGDILEQAVRDLPAKRRAARKVEMASVIAESAKKSATRELPDWRVVPLPPHMTILGAPAHQFNSQYPDDPNRCCECGLPGAEGNHFGDFPIAVPAGSLTSAEADPVQDFISRRIAKRESAKRESEYQAYLSRPVQTPPVSPQAIALDRAMTIAAPIRYTHEFGNPKICGF